MNYRLSMNIIALIAILMPLPANAADSLNVLIIEESPMCCLGFQAIVTRGTEWAATGDVTLPLPEDFPTDAGVSLAE